MSDAMRPAGQAVMPESRETGGESEGLETFVESNMPEQYMQINQEEADLM